MARPRTHGWHRPCNWGRSRFVFLHLAQWSASSVSLNMWPLKWGMNTKFQIPTLTVQLEPYPVQVSKIQCSVVQYSSHTSQYQPSGSFVEAWENSVTWSKLLWYKETYIEVHEQSTFRGRVSMLVVSQGLIWIFMVNCNVQGWTELN